MPTIRLWLREDLDREGKRQPAKALAREAAVKPGAGRVVDVDAQSVGEARRVLAVASQPEPDKKGARQAWNDWDEARERLRDVDLPLPAAPGKRRRMVTLDAEAYADLYRMAQAGADVLHCDLPACPAPK